MLHKNDFYRSIQKKAKIIGMLSSSLIFWDKLHDMKILQPQFSKAYNNITVITVDNSFPL